MARAIKLDQPGLGLVRRQLIGADLVAYEKPLYQVLDLAEESKVASSAQGQLRSVADILRQAMGGAA